MIRTMSTAAFLLLAFVTPATSKERATAGSCSSRRTCKENRVAAYDLSTLLR